MEASGVVFRPLPCFSGAGIDAHSHSSSKPSLVSCRDSRVRRFCGFSNNGFSDNGHIQYYRGPAVAPVIRCGRGKKEKVKEKELKDMTQKKVMKKRLKLLKGLSRDLSVFSSELGFGLNPQNHDLVDQVKGKMISEATDLLLGQLQQLRAEEKELKKKRKEEKAKLKAARMQNRLDCELSSGSSSESSDSECGEVVDMSSLKKLEATLALPNTLSQEGDVLETQPVIVQDTMLATVSQTANIMSKARGIECSSLQNTPTSLNLTEKIEVCMGGKCKKMGAPALMEEFQRVLGAEDAVVGCKCMGKCRDGPNVRVLNSSDGVDDLVRTPPLCIGVGFEDVSLIVANFFGETQRDMGLATAS